MYCVYFYSEDARYKNIHYPARAGNIKRQENVYEQDYQFTGRISQPVQKRQDTRNNNPHQRFPVQGHGKRL